MAVNSLNFDIISRRVEVDTSRRVDHLDVEIVHQDCKGKVFITDVMLQSGTVATSWVGHVSEIRWSFDNV